jgi:hypothetical protein
MVIMKLTQSSTNDIPEDRRVELHVQPDATALTLSCEASALGTVDERFLEFVVKGRHPKEEYRITFDKRELGLLMDLIEKLDKHYSLQDLEKGRQ